MADIALDYERASDVELCRLVVQRYPHAVRVITSRNNQRLYRAAWSVLKHRAEAVGGGAGRLSQSVRRHGQLRRHLVAIDLAARASSSTRPWNGAARPSGGRGCCASGPLPISTTIW